MSLISLTDTGLTYLTFNEIKTEIENIIKGVYGNDVVVEPGTPDGDLIYQLAELFNDGVNNIVALYEALNPLTATGVVLDGICGLNGIVRKSATYSQCDVVLTGVANTSIAAGIVSDINGNLWNLPENTQIGSNGNVTVTATSQLAGKIVAQIDEINKIETPVTGWTSVNNTVASSIGQPVETDEQLRFRRRESTLINAVTPLESLSSFLETIENVTDVIIFENDTSATITLKNSTDTLSSHSIAVVIAGGDNQTIGEAILNKRTLGCGTFGSESIEIISDIGNPSQTVYFTRPTLNPIKVQITIKQLDNYNATSVDLIKQACVDYIEQLKISEDIYNAIFYSVSNNADPLFNNTNTFVTTGVQIAKSADALSTNDINQEYKELATLELTNVEVVVV